MRCLLCKQIATVALAEAVEQITKVKESMDNKANIISSLTDSLALMGHANYDLSLHRLDIRDPRSTRNFMPFAISKFQE